MSDTEPAPAAPAEQPAALADTVAADKPRRDENARLAHVLAADDDALAAAARARSISIPASPESPSGIVVTVYDVPAEQYLERIVSAIDAVRRLGPGKVIVDMAGPGLALARALFERGISVQPLNKIERRDLKDQQMRLLNCRALLERVERALRQGTLVSDEGVRGNLLFDIEALAERC